jgi:hypothetical protein
MIFPGFLYLFGPHGASRKKAVAFLLAFAIMSMLAGASFAATLTDRDYRYLAEEYGLKRDGPFLQNLGEDEKNQLHAVINDPEFSDVPKSRDANVADVLFRMEIRTCNGRPKGPGEVCSLEPGTPLGERVADLHCISCHLTGTMEARSFYKMSRDGIWDEKRLAAALASGHQMSPITLSPEELKQLAIYISSLSK